MRRDEPFKGDKVLEDEELCEVVGVTSYKEILDSLYSSGSCLRVAIKGDWGTGKTTLLRALAQSYKNEDALVVTFEAWKYAFEDDPFIPLLEAIYSVEGADSVFKRRLKEVIKTLGVTTSTLLEAFLKQVSVDVESIEDWFKRFESFLYKKKSKRTQKLELLRKAIEDLKKKKKCNKFVLAVDDLDRLIPERAFRLLEALYLYFDIPGSIVIMAVNDTILNEYVRKHYGVKDRFQEDFLDKLFHFGIELQLSPLTKVHLKDFFGGEKFKELENVRNGGEKFKICEELLELPKGVRLTHCFVQ